MWNPRLFGLQNILRIIAKENGLSMEYQNESTKNYYGTQEKSPFSVPELDHIGQPYTTQDKVIHTPAINPEWSIDKQEDIVAVSIHEANHHSESCRDDFDLMLAEKISYGTSYYGRLLNIKSDYRNENMNWGKYAGADRMLGNLRYKIQVATEKGVYNKDYLKKRENEIPEDIDPTKREDGLKRMDIMDTIGAFDLHHRKSWMTQLKGLDHSKNLSVRSQRWLQELKDHHAKEYLEADTAYKCKDWTDKVLTEVFEYDVEELQEEAKKQFIPPTVAGGSGEPSKDGRTAAKGKKGHSSKGGDPSDEIYDEWFERYYEKVDQDPHSETRATAGHKIIYQDRDFIDDGYIPRPQPIVYHTKEIKENIDNYWINEVKKEWSHTSNLAAVVRKLLQVRSQARWTGRQLRGRLHNRSLARIADWNVDIFKKKEVSNVLDTTVTLLCDFSGSMGGYYSSKYGCSCAATVQLMDAICTNNIPLEVIGFTDLPDWPKEEYTDHRPFHIIMKQHKERITTQQMYERFSKYTDHLGNNADGESLLWTAERLLQQPEKRKILIVLSDGQPASSTRYNDAAFLNKVTKEIEDNWPIELYALGILTDSPKQFYKDYAIVNNTNELNKALLTVIKQKIIGD